MLGTCFVGFTHRFTFFEFDRNRMIDRSTINLWRTIRIMFNDLVHLHILLSHFHLLICFMLSYGLAETLIKVLLTTLRIWTAFIALLKTNWIAWITWCIRSWFNFIAIYTISHWHLLVLTMYLAINLWPYSVVAILRFLVFVISWLHV